MECGAECAIGSSTGVKIMPESCVANWDSPIEVE